MKKTKKDIDPILIANWYLIKCKEEGDKIDLARKYLSKSISSVLEERTKVKKQRIFFLF